MCGIAGLLYRDPTFPLDPQVLAAMGQAVAHRGPDGEGCYRGAGAALLHRRLSIIDLDTGAQPVGNETGLIQVVFNGEIYNYRQLRLELEGKGHQFATRSDTEVLVHLYEEVGEGLVDRLRGMFAFALWDSRQRRLLMARDRVGLKPLYYYQDPEKLIFSSELKGILAHPGLDLTIDEKALESFLAFGYVPGELSIFRRVRKLPPGHLLSLAQGNTDPVVPRRYWRFCPRVDIHRTLDEWVEAIDAKISETVAAHLTSDVPVGAYLSGGLDSSSVVEVISRQGGGRIKTFSIGFEEESFSELPYARQVARQFGTDHYSEVVAPSAADILDSLVHFYDEPFADSSAIPSLYLARLARQHVKVVLSGDGGDEAFGGYPRYAHDLIEARLRGILPAWLRRGFVRSLSRRWPTAPWLPRPLRLKTLFTNLSLDADDAYANTVTLCRQPLRRQLLGDDACAKLNGYVPELRVAGHYGHDLRDDPLSAMMRADVEQLLPDDFLTKTDRASMSCGLEVRPPYVDHELLELAAQVPSKWKVRKGQTKWILKRVFRDRLPHGIADRRKRGFEVPMDEWLRGPLRERFESLVLSADNKLASWLDQAVIRRVYTDHLRHKAHHGGILWACMVLTAWSQEYLKSPLGRQTGRAVGYHGSGASGFPSLSS